MRGWQRFISWWRRRTPPPTAPVVPTQALPPAAEWTPRPPDDATIRSRHVWITARNTGLVIRRRAGYTGWLEVCDLRWADIAALELDSGTHDAARMLYASVRASPMRKPLIDQAHLAGEQWHDLRDSVAAWTGQRVQIDLTHLPRHYEAL